MADRQSTDVAAARAAVEARLAGAGRLSASDAAVLLAATDLSWLGGLADRARAAAVGDRVAFSPADSYPLVLRCGRDDPDETARALLALRAAADAEPARQVVLVRTEAEPAVAPAESMLLSAVARLVLDNVPDLACDLASHPEASAELMLHFGTSALLAPPADFDADDLATLISDAGFRPVRVDPDGAELHDYGPAVPQARRRAEPQSVFA
jgi:aminodeoxyfutalosine synthase